MIPSGSAIIELQLLLTFLIVWAASIFAYGATRPFSLLEKISEWGYGLSGGGLLIVALLLIWGN